MLNIRLTCYIHLHKSSKKTAENPIFNLLQSGFFCITV